MARASTFKTTGKITDPERLRWIAEHNVAQGIGSISSVNGQDRFVSDTQQFNLGESARTQAAQEDAAGGMPSFVDPNSASQEEIGRTEGQEPTVGELFSGFVPQADEGIASAEQNLANILKKQQEEPDEAKIRENTMDRFQAEIDALNRVYAEKKAAENIRGRGRIGSSTAIQSRRGLVGSDFGASQTEAVHGMNKAAMDAIQAEQRAELQAIMSQVRNSVAAELAAKTAAQKQGAEEYVTFLTGQRERKALRVSDAIENAFYSGVEIGDDTFSQMAEELGVDVDILKGQYNKFKEKNTETTEAAKSIKVSPGDSIYNPATGKFVTAPAKPSDPTKPETRTAKDGAIWQWDPTKKEWEMVIPGGGDGEASGLTVGGENEDASKLSAQAETLTEKINLIDSITSSPGFKSAVGPNSAARFSLGEDLNAKRTNAIALIDQLLSQETLDTLTELKSRGGTLGALSEKELAILQGAASALSNLKITDLGEGRSKVNPGFKTTEKFFNEQLELIKDSAERLKAGIETEIGSLGTTSTPVIDQDAVDQLMQEMGITRQEAEQALGAGTSRFNSVGSDTEQATTGSLSLGNITAYGSFREDGSPIWAHGLDIDLKIGDPIKSDVDGVVEFVGTNGGFGNQVRVTDTNGNSVWYSHLDGMDVQPGQQIKRGQLLGTGGNTGTTVPGKGGDGSHLDLTVKRPDGTYMSPREIEQRLIALA